MESATTSLFEEPYWLDAVTPGDWHEAVVMRDGQTIGRLPYVIKRRIGLNFVAKPWYTTWLGPYVAPCGGKYTAEISHQHQILEELIKQLPRAAQTDIYCAPEYSNMLAFHWAGFRLSMAYTHRLDSTNPDQIWDNMRDTVRRQIRKAEKQLVIRQGEQISDVISILEKTFGRQSINVSSSYPVLERIDAAMAARNQRQIWLAEDAQGRIHAAIYCVYDSRHIIYLAGGGDPELRQSGAQSFAMWHAIQSAKGIAPIFDFAGSMVPGIEYFVRGFAARQTPRFAATRYDGIGKLLALRSALSGA